MAIDRYIPSVMKRLQRCRESHNCPVGVLDTVRLSLPLSPSISISHAQSHTRTHNLTSTHCDNKHYDIDYKHSTKGREIIFEAWRSRCNKTEIYCTLWWASSALTSARMLSVFQCSSYKTKMQLYSQPCSYSYSYIHNHECWLSQSTFS